MSILDQSELVIRMPTAEDRLRLHKLLESFENVDEDEAKEQRESFDMIRRALKRHWQDIPPGQSTV